MNPWFINLAPRFPWHLSSTWCNLMIRTRNFFYISVCTKPIVGLSQDIPFWVIAILSFPFWECCHWLLPIQFCLWLSNLCLYFTMELNGRSWIVLWLCLKGRLRAIYKWHCRLYFMKMIHYFINPKYDNKFHRGLLK